MTDSIYFLNLDYPDEIIKLDTSKYLVMIISKRNLRWRPVSFDHPYCREIFLGQGNNCLYEINFDEVQTKIASWKTINDNTKLKL